jgi:hypothetical protein
MNDQQLHETESSKNGTATAPPRSDNQGWPDYPGWCEFQEASKSVLVRLIDVLSRRTIHEIAVVLAQVGPFVLARDIIASHGGGMPPLQEFACVIVLAVMTFAPALYHLHSLVGGKLSHAQNFERDKDPPQPGNE